jgi:hypothetical protein
MTGIRGDVEKRFYEFLSEVGEKIGAERIEQFVENALTGAARTKKAVDKNVETLLSLANIPSRRDYDRMRAKLDALQGSIINLTRTVDDLRDRLASANGSPRRGKRRPTVRAKKARATAPKRPAPVRPSPAKPSSGKSSAAKPSPVRPSPVRHGAVRPNPSRPPPAAR